MTVRQLPEPIAGRQRRCYLDKELIGAGEPITARFHLPPCFRYVRLQVFRRIGQWSRYERFVLARFLSFWIVFEGAA